MAPQRFALGFVFVLGLVAAQGSVNAQDPFKENPIGPGAWVYPSEKISPETVAAFCGAGFTLYFSDGRFLSVLNQPTGRRKQTKSSVDTVGQCKFDTEKQSLLCVGDEMDGGKKFPLKEETRIERDGNHIRVTTTYLDRQSRQPATLVTYPMRCPDEIVRDILYKAIPPK